MAAPRIPNDPAARALRSMGYGAEDILGVWPRVGGATTEDKIRNALLIFGGNEPEAAPEVALPHPAAQATLPPFPRVVEVPDTTLRDQIVGALILVAIAYAIWIVTHH